MNRDPSLHRFRNVVAGALQTLEARRTEVNDLNVFPVADGDTGDNMALTLRAVLEELNRLMDAGEIDQIGRDQIVDSVARAALLGARGNSGVILSQLVRGAAEELISRPGELVDPVLVSAAMARAADRAYESVREPAEGTILTVVREMAARVASEVAHSDEPRFTLETGAREQDEGLADLLEAALDAGQESVRRGPELLAVLKEAGVVDAGGYGLTIIIAGVLAALRGTPPPELDHHAPARVSHPEHESSTYRYCTNFVVTGTELEHSAYVDALEALGDSVLVVGDGSTLKVHVHTDEPEQATALFATVGAVSHLDVADMHEQVAERSSRLAVAPIANGHAVPDATCGVLAVVSGAGMHALFGALGATTLEGGPTLNPSTYDLLTGIHEVPAEQVVVLPNSSNVIMAAERAAELSEKLVAVVHARSMQAGLSAALALNPAQPARANAAAMTEALAGVRTGAVAPAARDDTDRRFRAGDTIGFVGDELVAWGSPQDTLASVLRTLGDGAELVTCIAGDGAPLDPDAVRALAPDGVEVEVEIGGQPAYWYLLSAE